MKIEKRWFDDEDFTPKHDELMIWLMENWKVAVRYMLNQENDSLNKEFDIEENKFLGEPEIKGYPSVYPDAIVSFNLSKHHDGALIKVVDDENRKIIFKCPICSNTSTSDFSRNESEFQKAKNFQHTYTWLENYKCKKENSIDVLFEIKPKINSFGSVLRQIKIYQTRGYKKVILITNDNRFDKFFNEQNITVFHPNAGN